MTDTDTLQQLRAWIVEMEQHHEAELRKLKVDHDQLKAHVKRPQGKEHLSHTLLERTQGKSHP